LSPNTSSPQVTFTGTTRGNVIVKLLVVGKYNEEKTATMSIAVNQNLTAIQLPDGPIKLTLGSTTTNTHDLWSETTVAPSTMKDEIKDKVQWSVSDDNKIITVADGVVTGVKQGTATVTVTYKNEDGTTVSDSVRVNVFEDPIKKQNRY